MGYYINNTKNGPLPPVGKIDRLMNDEGARKLEFPPSSLSALKKTDGLICVINDRYFEAAVFCYDDNELEAFADPHDERDKIWLTMPLNRIIELTGYGK